MPRSANTPHVHQLSVDDSQVEILVDALQMRRDYLAVALEALDRDAAASQARHDLDATDALLRRLLRPGQTGRDAPSAPAAG